MGITCNNKAAQLTFRLILNWSGRTRLEEVVAVQVVRQAGFLFLVPRVLCYREHLNTQYAPVSILMTRYPGSDERRSIVQELKGSLEVMRGWEGPWGGSEFCSLLSM